VFLSASVLARGCFFVEPSGRDQTLFMTQASLWLKGFRLYADIFEHKPPGIIVLYATILRLFGQHFIAIQIAGWLSGLVTALLVSWLASRLGACKRAAVGAGVLYLAYQSGVAFGGFWAAGQVEVFMDPLVAALACLVLLGLTQRISATVALLLAGTCLAAALFLKYSTLPLTLVIAPLLLERGLSARDRARRLLVYLLGLSWSWLAFMGYLGLTQRLGPFIDATVVFNLAHARVSREPLLSMLGATALYGDYVLLPYYFFSALAIYTAVLAWVRHRRARPAVGRAMTAPSSASDAPPRALLSTGVALWILAWLQVVWQGKYWCYHYHVMLLPLSLIACAGMHYVASERERRRSSRVASVGTLALVAATVLPYGLSLVQYADAHHLAAYWLRRVSRARFEATYRWSGTDYCFGETREAAELIAKHTGPEERIFVWGFEPGLYLLADRLPSSRFLYDYPLMPSFKAVHARLMNELKADLDAHPPSEFVVVTRDANAIESSDSLTQLHALPELHRYLDSHYEQRWRVGDFIGFEPKGSVRHELGSRGVQETIAAPHAASRQ
jgi:hypothetical protein